MKGFTAILGEHRKSSSRGREAFGRGDPGGINTGLPRPLQKAEAASAAWRAGLAMTISPGIAEGFNILGRILCKAIIAQTICLSIIFLPQSAWSTSTSVTPPNNPVLPPNTTGSQLLMAPIMPGTAPLIIYKGLTIGDPVNRGNLVVNGNATIGPTDNTSELKVNGNAYIGEANNPDNPGNLVVNGNAWVKNGISVDGGDKDVWINSPVYIIGNPSKNWLYIQSGHIANNVAPGNLIFNAGTNETAGGIYFRRGNDSTNSMTIEQNGGVNVYGPIYARGGIPHPGSCGLAWFLYGKTDDNPPQAWMTGSGNNCNWGEYSIWASYKIGAIAFAAYSDARIKHVLNTSNQKEDLTSLQKLRVVNYQYIDKKQGNNVKKGFIAQEVEKIYPQAVSKTDDYIPNIYLATKDLHLSNHKELTIRLTKAHDLKVGDEVRIYPENESQPIETKVAKVLSPNAFVVNDWNKPTHIIFVYGKKVHDFRTLDYDQLFTMGISAIQELKTEIDNQDKKIALLEKEVARLTSRLDANPR